RRGKSSTGLNTGTCTEASVGDPHHERWRAHVPRFVAGRPPHGSLENQTRCPKVVEIISLVRTSYAAMLTHEVVMRDHPIVSQDEWLAVRLRLLAKEKEFTRQRDQLSEERRALPWVKVEKEYVFDGPNGRQTLSQLFQGRSQLLIYHFIYGTDWHEGCRGEPSNDPGNKDSCHKGTYCVVEAIHVRTGVPDLDLDRCDGHHEMVDLKLTKNAH